MSFKVHKKNQGFYTRFTCLLLAWAMGLYASYRLYYFGEAFGEFWEDTERVYTSWADSIPIIGEMITPGFFLSTLFFFLIGLALYWASFCNERWSEFLVETETELRKVSWPSREELMGSSTVVVIAVIILSAYLGVVDALLGKMFSFLL